MHFNKKGQQDWTGGVREEGEGGGGGVREEGEEGGGGESAQTLKSLHAQIGLALVCLPGEFCHSLFI